MTYNVQEANYHMKNWYNIKLLLIHLSAFTMEKLF